MRTKAKNHRKALLLGLGSGAALMYVLDPSSGARRRALIRDQVVHTRHALLCELDRARRDLGHRGQGFFARLRSFFSRDRASDEKIIARVRSVLGRCVAHPRALEARCSDGCVSLYGPVLVSEVDELVKAVHKVRGVQRVDDHLERYVVAGGVPSLQGGRDRSRMITREERWPPALRVGLGFAGAYFALKGLRRGGFFGHALTSFGGAILLRATANRPSGRLLGVGESASAIRFHKTIVVQAPVDEVYRFWTQIENFPKFMNHVHKVERIDDVVSRWTVAGPAGAMVSWDARITQMEPNAIFGWKTLPGALVEHEGVVRFREGGDGATRLDIDFSYRPPAGVLGHGIASLFNADPKHAMDDDLVRLKSLLEEGKSRAHGREVRFEELGQR